MNDRTLMGLLRIARNDSGVFFQSPPYLFKCVDMYSRAIVHLQEKMKDPSRRVGPKKPSRGGLPARCPIPYSSLPAVLVVRGWVSIFFFLREVIAKVPINSLKKKKIDTHPRTTSTA